jgi:adenosylmethionine-8-amino-7-oxononanoate aminotransferase
MGATLAPAEMVETVAESGGFLHGHTYSANPLSCAIGHAVVSEMVRQNMMANAERMGARLRGRLEEIKSRSAILGDVRGKGLLMAIEIVANKETKALVPAEHQAVYRIIELGIERGLLLYSRRTANGKYGEWLMVSPPLIVTESEVDEIATLIEATLAAYEKELRQLRVI